MLWVSTLSLKNDGQAAIEDCCDRMHAQLAGMVPDLVFFFISPHHFSQRGTLLAKVHASLAPRHLIGCTGGGLIGENIEAEDRAAISITAAVLPNVHVIPFHLDNADLPDITKTQQLVDRLDVPGIPQFVLLPDPFSVACESALRVFDLAYPDSVKVGGVVSGGFGPGTHALFWEDHLMDSGMVGVALSGNIRLETVVAQGCRPIGKPMFITGCHDNQLTHLNNQPPGEVLDQLYARLDDKDRAMFRHALYLGIEMTLKEGAYGQGDFLIRPIMDRDQSTGALKIGGQLQETAVVQFHLRDALTSHEDLVRQFMRYKATHGEKQPAGVLLFSCLGRGRGLYGEPNHDAELFARQMGNVPMAGFFCNGEIGPVNQQTFLHAYTSSFGLFYPLRRAGKTPQDH